MRSAARNVVRVGRPGRRASGLGALCGAALALAACGGSEEPAEESSGFMRAPSGGAGTVLAAEKEEPAATPPPAPAPQLETPEPAAPEVPATSEPELVESDAPATPEPAPQPGLPARDASDLEIAAALLHRSYAAFAQLVDLRGAEIPDDRRKLLLAFSAARSGQPQQAAETAAGLEDSPSLSEGEARLLREALEPASASGTFAPAAAATPLERAMQLSMLELGAAGRTAAGDSGGAAAAYSQLLLAELESPWEADRGALRRWSEALAQAQSGHRWSPRGAWPSLEVKVRAGDSLIAIRKRVLEEHPELLLCTGLIARANGLPDENAIRPDDVLRIPTERASVRVDVGARWVLYLHGDEVVCAWEVGVGKEDGATRVGEYTIGDKQSEPMWFQPGRDPIPFGDPENPLGTRWLAWNGDGNGLSLGFHGTSDPDGVGGRVSKGCVRMLNEDVELLYAVLPRGASVTVRP